MAGRTTRTTQKKTAKTKPRESVRTSKKAAISVGKKKVTEQSKQTTKKTVTKTKKTKPVVKVKAVHKRKTATKLAGNKFTNQETTIDSKQTSEKLLVPSLYRFPLDIHALAVKTARYGGVLFVLLGALFTLHYSNIIFSTSTTEYALTSNVVNTIDNLTNTKCNSTDSCVPIKSLLSEIKLTISDKILKETVPIELSVNNATEVRIAAYHKTQQQEYALGKMSKSENSRWKFLWNTNKMNDGEYILKFFVKNTHEAREFSDNKIYTVENNPLTIAQEQILKEDKDEKNEEKSTASSEKSDTSENGETIEVINQIPSVTLVTSDTGPFNEVVRFSIPKTEAQKIKLYLLNESGKSEKLLGYALQDSDNSWTYKLSVKDYDNGTYVVVAQVDDGETTINSNKVRFVVDHKKIDALDTKEIVDVVKDTSLLETVQNPEILIKFIPPSPLSDTTEIHVLAEDASFVELYAMNKQSAIRSYLGKALEVDTGVWRYFWNTHSLPTGTYKIAVKVKNKFGIFEQLSNEFVVRNEQNVARTTEQDEKITQLTEIAQEELKRETVKESQSQAENSSRAVPPEKQETTLVDSATNSDGENEYDVLLQTYETDIAGVLKKLAVAVRSEDTQMIASVKTEITQLKTKIKTAQLNHHDAEKLITYVDQKLDTATTKVEEDVKRTNDIIVQRTNEAASTDSDGDGITDFDEIHLFNTDPFSADTDNDGYVDGAEVVSGYDPTNAEPEAVVVFESPKETGVVREYILVVHAIAPALDDVVAESDQKRPPKAIITGKGLPNSYVTLYIFSTPVVVTIRTDEDGSWYYKFDKELEDGEHEVYVGITDNAGKIVAKSNPLVFVKQAEAFDEVGDTPVVNSVSQTDNSETFMSVYMMYLVLSLSVVSIGLVLILLGLYLNRRDQLILTEGQPITV